MMQRDDRDPSPDLHELIRAHGGSFFAITAEAWAKFDRDMDAWQQRRRMAYGPLLPKER